MSGSLPIVQTVKIVNSDNKPLILSASLKGVEPVTPGLGNCGPRDWAESCCRESRLRSCAAGRRGARRLLCGLVLSAREFGEHRKHRIVRKTTNQLLVHRDDVPAQRSGVWLTSVSALVVDGDSSCWGQGPFAKAVV